MINKLTILLLSLAMLSCGRVVSSNNKKELDMRNIEFIPEEFHNVKLGFYETENNVFTPPNADFLWNEIIIIAPEKIIIHSGSDTIRPIIPICGAYIIGQRRGLKYAHLSAKMLNIRKIGEEIWYSGAIIDPNLQYEHPALPPNFEEEQARRQQRIKEAQNYTDEEINEKVGQGSGSNININLMEYVDFPFEPGVYEIYLSFSGLESNRVKVEIIFKE
jgi:hypothetical protein